MSDKYCCQGCLELMDIKKIIAQSNCCSQDCMEKYIHRLNSIIENQNKERQSLDIRIRMAYMEIEELKNNRRFEAAKAAMQGIAAPYNHAGYSPQQTSKKAWEYADALLAELEKENDS